MAVSSINNDGIGAMFPPVFEDCSFANVHIIGECFARIMFITCSLPFANVHIIGECYDKHVDKREECGAIELIGFDESGYELKNIQFRDITIGKKEYSRKQTLSLQLCQNISFERIRCL